MPEVRFDKLVLDSIGYALSLLASEKLRYPNVAVTGGAALLLTEPRLSEVYSTRDVDLLLEFPTDVDEIFFTLAELERKRPDEIFTIATKGVAELAPLKRKELLPVDFVCPPQPQIRELFQYVRRNAKDMLAELRIDSQPVRVYLARPEDAILSKLAVGREKDLIGLRQLFPKLKELKRIDRTYLHTLAKRFDLEKEVKLLEKT